MDPILSSVVESIADALVFIDAGGVPCKNFQPGVGPYGETQLIKIVAAYLNERLHCDRPVCTKRTPDLLLPGEWAIECKIVRPFGDNDKPAENWSVNLLHPYEGNTSLIGDCFKLINYPGTERKAVVAIGYEHTPPRIDLERLLRAFEIVASEVCGIQLGERVCANREKLIHPVHQQLRVIAWEVLG
jgi:hypothetical protein